MVEEVAEEERDEIKVCDICPISRGGPRNLQQ